MMYIATVATVFYNTSFLTPGKLYRGFIKYNSWCIEGNNGTNLDADTLVRSGLLRVLTIRDYLNLI